MKIIVVDTSQIVDWESFHDVFATAFGFPSYYGRNLDAWIDCMTYLNDPAGSDTVIHAEAGQVLTLHLQHMSEFSRRCPDISAALVDCSAFVNYRLIEQGNPPTLALAWSD
jgi:hypothetical protein